MERPQNKHLQPFKEGDEWNGNKEGRPVGSKNRSTIARKWLEVELDEVNPLTGEVEKLSLEDIITLQQIKQAKGITLESAAPAYKNIMDSAYGAPKQETEHSGTMGIIWQEVKTYDDPNKKADGGT